MSLADIMLSETSQWEGNRFSMMLRSYKEPRTAILTERGIQLPEAGENGELLSWMGQEIGYSEYASYLKLLMWFTLFNL